MIYYIETLATSSTIAAMIPYVAEEFEPLSFLSSLLLSSSPSSFAWASVFGFDESFDLAATMAEHINIGIANLIGVEDSSIFIFFVCIFNLIVYTKSGKQ